MFITKAEIIDFTGIEASLVKDIDVWVSNTKVESYLVQNRFERGKYDGSYPQLKVAALFFACELFANKGLIDIRIGDIIEEKIGQIEIKRGRHPMFFFSRGMTRESQSMWDMLPHESFRQQAYSVLASFVREHTPDIKSEIISYGRDERVT